MTKQEFENNLDQLIDTYNKDNYISTISICIKFLLYYSRQNKFQYIRSIQTYLNNLI